MHQNPRLLLQNPELRSRCEIAQVLTYLGTQLPSELVVMFVFFARRKALLRNQNQTGRGKNDSLLVNAFSSQFYQPKETQ
jgi:hypothetical protein